MARALDVLGDRWTLLIVRELLLGPTRFTTLLSALTGIGANRLSDRLKRLEATGVIRRSAPDEPAYVLTPFGERLRDPLVALGLWGLELPWDERIAPEPVRAELIAMSLAGTQTTPLDTSRREAVEFHVDDGVFHLLLHDGWYVPRAGAYPGVPEVRVSCDTATFVGLAQRAVSAADAVSSGAVQLLTGSQRALAELYRVLVYSPGALPPARL